MNFKNKLDMKKYYYKTKEGKCSEHCKFTNNMIGSVNCMECTFNIGYDDGFEKAWIKCSKMKSCDNCDERKNIHSDTCHYCDNFSNYIPLKA